MTIDPHFQHFTFYPARSYLYIFLSYFLSYFLPFLAHVATSSRRSRSNDGSDYPSDEELQFYDCEEEGSNNGHSGFFSSHSRPLNRNRDGYSNSSSSANLKKSALSSELLRFYQHQPGRADPALGYYNNSKNSTQGDLIQLEDGTAAGNC